MNRRNFLKFLGVGVAVAAAAPSVVAALEPVCQTQAPIAAVIAEYSDYVNFSDLAIARAIDAHVSEAAAQLGHQAGLTLNALHSQTFDYQPSQVTRVKNSETPLKDGPRTVFTRTRGRSLRPGRIARSSSMTRSLQTQRG